jgi:hypothetical protein
MLSNLYTSTNIIVLLLNLMITSSGISASRVVCVNSPRLSVGRSKLCGACTLMGPRTSLSGELPIDSYFRFSSKTAGTSGNKEKRSLKRRTEADAPDEAFSSTKKQRTKRPSERTVLDSQGRLCSGIVSVSLNCRGTE